MNDLLNKIKGLVLRDIITVGYCENMDDHLRYRPLLDVMYLEFEGFYLLIKTSNNDIHCTISQVEKIELNIEIEEGDVFAQSSIYELTLMDSVSEHIIRSFSLSNVQIISANEISCESLLLQTNIQTIFFDPSFVEGIKITNEFRSQTNII